MSNENNEFGNPCRKIYAPIGPHEMRIIVREDGSQYYAITIDTHSKYCKQIEEILHKMFSAKGGSITQEKRRINRETKKRNVNGLGKDKEDVQHR